MNWQNALSFGSLTAATAVAVLTAAIIPRFHVGSPPLFDDLICWILVLAIVGYPSAANSRIWEINGVSSETPLKCLYWIAASSMVLNATLSSLFDTIWIYVSSHLALYDICANLPLLACGRLCTSCVSPKSVNHASTRIAASVPSSPIVCICNRNSDFRIARTHL